MTQEQKAEDAKRAAVHDDVMRLLGPMDDGKCVAIIATGATIQDVEEVAAWLAGEDDVMGKLQRPLSGVAGEVYELLTADEAPDEDL